jgi:hypothetical protein
MNGIVERLRGCAALEEAYDEQGIMFIGMKKSLKHEAADEIERLRGLLREFLAAHDSYEVHKRVREALGDG